jgi:hypothetical protein
LNERTTRERPATARRFGRVACTLGLASLLLAGCDSDADIACRDVGNCTHGGSDDWISACREQNDDLSDEAQAVGCNAEFEAYFSCAEDRFACTGNQSSFPGCEPKLKAYSACLASKAAGTACAKLEQGLAACGEGAPDPSDPALALSPCTASGDCSAHCYLESVPNLCAPLAAELAAFADCASHCVF